jgi:hypothetical protein
MVSTAMQGGCTCENTSYLRIGTGNIELAAMCAPRPLGMSAANDWTRELETKGLPELKQHYTMLGVPDHVEGKYFDFDHNYNQVSRKMMYEFFNRHLKLGQASPIEEREFKPLTVEEMSVWNDEHPKPAMDVDAELKMLRAWDEASQKQLEAMRPKDYESLAKYRVILGGAIDIMVGRGLPKSEDVENWSCWSNRRKKDTSSSWGCCGTTRTAKKCRPCSSSPTTGTARSSSGSMAAARMFCCKTMANQLPRRRPCWTVGPRSRRSMCCTPASSLTTVSR